MSWHAGQHVLTTASSFLSHLMLKLSYHVHDILPHSGNVCWLSVDQNFSLENIRSQLSNAVPRNVIRLLDQKLHCFTNKSYFSKFFEFYNNQRHHENLLKKVKNSNNSKIWCIHRTTSVDTAFESLDIVV